MISKYKIYCETDSKWELVIADSVPTVCPTGGGHTVRAGSASIAEEQVLINDGTPKSLSLSNYKILRYNEINGKTLALIEAGFTYDSSHFRCDLMARVNYGHIKQFENDLTWPMNIACMDGSVYSLAQVDLPAFIDAALAHSETVMQGGNTLIDSVSTAVDEAAVDAVIDTR